jgi:hypothetical protein
MSKPVRSRELDLATAVDAHHARETVCMRDRIDRVPQHVHSEDGIQRRWACHETMTLF